MITIPLPLIFLGISDILNNIALPWAEMMMCWLLFVWLTAEKLLYQTCYFITVYTYLLAYNCSFFVVIKRGNDQCLLYCVILVNRN